MVEGNRNDPLFCVGHVIKVSITIGSDVTTGQHHEKGAERNIGNKQVEWHINLNNFEIGGHLTNGQCHENVTGVVFMTYYMEGYILLRNPLP